MANSLALQAVEACALLWQELTLQHALHILPHMNSTAQYHFLQISLEFNKYDWGEIYILIQILYGGFNQYHIILSKVRRI